MASSGYTRFHVSDNSFCKDNDIHSQAKIIQTHTNHQILNLTCTISLDYKVFIIIIIKWLLQSSN